MSRRRETVQMSERISLLEDRLERIEYERAAARVPPPREPPPAGYPYTTCTSVSGSTMIGCRP